MVKESKNEDGSYTWTFTDEDDPETVMNLIAMSEAWGVQPNTPEFDAKFEEFMTERIESLDRTLIFNVKGDNHVG
jgi:hypothetical protein